MTYFIRKGNKYKNIPQLYNGNRYDSKKESEFARELDLRLKTKDIKAWERQVKIELRVNGYLICNYYMDFVIMNNDGSKEYIEVKGFETQVWQLKKKLFEALLPEIDPGAEYVIVK